MKNKMPSALCALAAAIALPQSSPARAADCGTAGPVTIAEMTWLSASTLAYVTQHILKDGYGCDAQIVPGARCRRRPRC